MLASHIRLLLAKSVRIAMLTSVALLLVGTSATETYSTVPSVSLGHGRAKVVEYDLDLQPVRAWTGLEKPTDITPFPDGTILLVDEEMRRVMLLDPSGPPRWSEPIGELPARARPRPGGGYLVTSRDNVVLATRPDRTIEWSQTVPNVRTAVPLANGNILTASNDTHGWITELTPEGRTVWRSDERSTEPGKERTLYFVSVWPLDAGADGTIFTAVFDGSELRVIGSDRKQVRKIPGMAHTVDTRIGPQGELVAVSPEAYRVWIQRPNGQVETFPPPMRPISANLTPWGTILVGMTWEPERAALRATALRAEAGRIPPWWKRGTPIPFLGVLAAFVIAGWLRRNEVRQLIAGGPTLRSTGPSEPARATTTRARWVTALGVLALLVFFCLAVAMARSAIIAVESQWSSAAAARFLVGCALAGIALRLLNTLIGSTDTLSSFVPASWDAPNATPDRKGRVLLGISLASILVCAILVAYRPSVQAVAVALWLAAQVLILAAAFPPRSSAPAERAPMWVHAAMGLVIAAAVVMRFWQIGYYPDFVHHDHVIYGDEALNTLRGQWTPFFSRVYSVGRPTFIPLGAALEVFGHHYWVLRLMSAIAGVAIVWGTYLLATALFNWRVGLFAAALAMANNVLLLYSRQVYVLDPVAPFVFALYCAVIGLRRGSNFHWCLAGFLSAWALMGYYTSVTFVPVGGALLLYLLLFYPRRMWGCRAGLLWFLAGAVVVYLPMLAEEFRNPAVLYRARNILVFLKPDGSFNWDPQLWKHQLGASFGSIFFFPETAPWVVSTGQSVCMRYGSILCGIGATYLLLSWRSPATFLLLAWTVICIFLGCGTLPDTPTYYHMLAAVVPLMIASAVALERAVALTDRMRLVPTRALSWALALAALALVTTTQLQAVWRAVERPPPTDGLTVYTANARIMAARFIREHPEYRFYLVRSAANVDATSDNEIFRFFAADSDVSDVSNDLTDVLPVPPVEPAAGAAFIVLPTRREDAKLISETYPSAKIEEIIAHPTERVWVYLVDAATVRNIYEARRGAGDGTAVASGSS